MSWTYKPMYHGNNDDVGAACPRPVTHRVPTLQQDGDNLSKETDVAFGSSEGHHEDVACHALWDAAGQHEKHQEAAKWHHLHYRKINIMSSCSAAVNVGYFYVCKRVSGWMKEDYYYEWLWRVIKELNLFI